MNCIYMSLGVCCVPLLGLAASARQYPVHTTRPVRVLLVATSKVRVTASNLSKWLLVQKIGQSTGKSLDPGSTGIAGT